MSKDGNCFDNLIGPSVWHRSIDGDKLVILRGQLGISQSSLAERVGHSQQFQAQLERPGIHEISKEKADEIYAALKLF